MIRRRFAKRRVQEKELQDAKLRTSVSALRARRDYRASVDRLVHSQQVAKALSLHNDSLERFGIRVVPGSPKMR